MVASARRLVVLADSTKWGVVGLGSMAELSEATTVISDDALGAHARRELQDRVDELILVDVSSQPAAAP